MIAIRTYAAAILVLAPICLGADAPDLPRSERAVASRQRFDATCARAAKTLADSEGVERNQYLKDLQRVLDNAMRASNVDDANWANAEIARVRKGEVDLDDRPGSEFAAALSRRHITVINKAQEEDHRVLEAARKRYLSELETAKRIALSEQKDLSEGNRIVGEILRVKSLDFTPRPLGAIDLLKQVDVDKDAVAGTWVKNELGIQSTDTDDYSRLRLPYTPRGSYDFRVTFTRLQGDGDVDLILNFADKRFMFLMGAWHNTVCGFGQVGGKSANGNRTTIKAKSVFTNGQTYTAVVKVRRGSVAAYIDGTLVSALMTDYSDLGAPQGRDLGPNYLGIEVYASPTVIRSAQVVPVLEDPRAK